MEADQQKRARELARRLVNTARPSQAPHVWTRSSVIPAHNTMVEHMPITEEELNNSLREANRKVRRIQTRQIEGITYLRAQPRFGGNNDERYVTYPTGNATPSTNHSEAHLETPTKPPPITSPMHTSQIC